MLENAHDIYLCFKCDEVAIGERKIPSKDVAKIARHNIEAAFGATGDSGGFASSTAEKQTSDYVHISLNEILSILHDKSGYTNIQTAEMGGRPTVRDMMEGKKTEACKGVINNLKKITKNFINAEESLKTSKTLAKLMDNNVFSAVSSSVTSVVSLVATAVLGVAQLPDVKIENAGQFLESPISLGGSITVLAVSAGTLWLKNRINKVLEAREQKAYTTTVHSVGEDSKGRITMADKFAIVVGKTLGVLMEQKVKNDDAARESSHHKESESKLAKALEFFLPKEMIEKIQGNTR